MTQDLRPELGNICSFPQDAHAPYTHHGAPARKAPTESSTGIDRDPRPRNQHPAQGYGDRRQVSQKFLVSFDQERSMSQVRANAFFEGGI